MIIYHKPYFRIYLLAIFAVLILSTSVYSQRYEMVWSDEFDQQNLDEDNWYKWNRTAFNQEYQYYTDRDTNVYVQDGMLYLVGLRENYGGRGWTSGRIESQDRFEFKYGKVEIRAKLPEGKGLWPAFWMLGSNIDEVSWPYSGEIDIMEFRGHLPAQTAGTVHFSTVSPENSTGTSTQDRRYISDEYNLPTGSFTSDFHLYQFSWTDSVMTWSIDNIEFFRLTREEIEEQTEYYPFDQPFYFILNLAIGGTYLGDAQPDNSTPHRNEVIVDYIRVFQDANKAPSIDLGFQDVERIDPYTNLEVSPEIADEDGTVKEVEFYLNGELVSSFTSPPYQYKWQPGIEGCYDFKIRAVDNEDKEAIHKTKFIVGSGCERSPFNDQKASFPGTLELEHYDIGGLGKSYYDTTPDTNLGNAQGNSFRSTEAVDIIPDKNEEGNYLISHTEDGEWTKYTLEVEEGGVYDLEFRSVPGSGSARVNFLLNGEDWIYFTRIIKQDGEEYNVKTTRNVEIQKGTYDLEMQIAINGESIKPDYLKAELKEITTNEAEKTELPPSVALTQNYPNPFNPTTQISVQLPASQNVNLSIFNALGQHIKTLHTGTLTTGHHTFTFNGAGLSSGIYYYQLKNEEVTLTRKMLLLK